MRERMGENADAERLIALASELVSDITSWLWKGRTEESPSRNGRVLDPVGIESEEWQP